MPIGISAVIVATERRKFLAQALKSAIDQDIDPEEYEIVLIKNYSDESFDRILLGFPRNVRLTIIDSMSREYGKKVVEAASICEGRVLSLLDDDDVWEQDKLRTVMVAFSSDPSLVYFHNGQHVFGDTGLRSKSCLTHGQKYDKLLVDMTSISSLAGLLRLRADFNDSSISILKEIVLDRRREFGVVNATMDSFMFYIALEGGGRLLIDPKRLTSYRMVGQSLSLTNSLNFNDFVNDRLTYHTAQVESLEKIRNSIITTKDKLGVKMSEVQVLSHRMLVSVLSGRERRSAVAIMFKSWLQSVFTHRVFYEPSVALCAFTYLVSGRLARFLLYVIATAKRG